MLKISNIQAARQAEGIRAAEAETEVARGTSDGLAVLAFSNGSRTICRIAAGPYKALHDQILQPFEGLLKAELRGGPTTMVSATADGAFLSIKRGNAELSLAPPSIGFPRQRAGTGRPNLPLPADLDPAPDTVAKAQAALTDQDATKPSRARRGRAPARARPRPSAAAAHSSSA